MKKIITFILAVALCVFVPVSFTACTPRSEILRIYNWGDYMDEATYKDFEAWYKQQTGEKVKVVYNEFDSNEGMYGEIRSGADYDLVCPSDYMMERMIKENLVQPMSEETQTIVRDAAYEPLTELMEFDAGMEYSMPYIWGTFGIMYNEKSTGLPDMSSWNALFSATSNAVADRKIYMKDSERDIYTVALLQKNSAELLRLSGLEGGYENQEYKNLLNSIFDNITTDKIVEAETVLKAQIGVKDYDIDEAKNDLKRDTNGTKGEFGLFWSCDAGIVMSGDGANKNLRYVVPEEGSNVWVDCFAITKKAKNVKAANYFIQYLCQDDISYDCTSYVGAPSGIEAGYNAYYEELNAEDNEFFVGAPEGFKEMYMDMMFPPEDVMNRCMIMKDASNSAVIDRLGSLLENVKG